MAEVSSTALRQRGLPADEGLVATFACLLSLPAGLRSVVPRRLALALSSLAALATALLLSAAPAAAVVTTVNSHKYGIEPSSGGNSAAGSSVHPSPVATQAVVSRSLSTALRSGLVVRYSVNEQVAGRFEVLLASSIASRIGLRGARATGLAKGTPAQTVIAKAILVTTRGGRSTYKIKFSKTSATRLRRLRKVSLMLRLAVHNAFSPTVTTAISTVTLSG